MDWLSAMSNWITVVGGIGLFIGVLRKDRQLMGGHAALWVLSLIAIAGVAAVNGLSVAQRAHWLPERALQSFSHRRFANETVVLDGHAYYGCTFENVRFQYAGGHAYFAADNRFEGDRSFLIPNEHAADVIKMLLAFKALTLPPDNPFKLPSASP